MSVNITPLHHRVLVRRLEQKEAAKGGIIIYDTDKEMQQEGEVMAVGVGKIEKGHRVFLDVKVWGVPAASSNSHRKCTFPDRRGFVRVFYSQSRCPSLLPARGKQACL